VLDLLQPPPQRLQDGHAVPVAGLVLDQRDQLVLAQGADAVTQITGGQPVVVGPRQVVVM